jgi:hypothetical protein
MAPAQRSAQRDVVYFGRPIAPSYMSPNAGGGGVAESQPMSTVVPRSPNKLGDLTPYLTYGVKILKGTVVSAQIMLKFCVFLSEFVKNHDRRGMQFADSACNSAATALFKTSNLFKIILWS